MSKVAVFYHEPPSVTASQSNPTPQKHNTNKPELRMRAIKQYLETFDLYDLISTQELVLSREQLSECHDEEYLHFIEHVWESWDSQEQQDADFMNEDGGIIPYHFSRKANQNYKHLPLWKQMGHFCDDFTTPIYSHTYSTALASANNSHLASQHLLQQNHSIVYALNVFPGHHAHRDQYGGYCFFNNGAIATCTLLKEHQRVVLFDLDYHHGNGSQEVFKDNSNVLTISIHADPKIDYPSFSGFENENTESNKNYIFPKLCTWNQYNPILEKALGAVTLFEPDVLVISFGADTVKDDPDASVLAGCCLEVEDYFEMGKCIASTLPHLKILVLQEGGYYIEKIPKIVHEFLQGLALHHGK